MNDVKKTCMLTATYCQRVRDWLLLRNIHFQLKDSERLASTDRCSPEKNLGVENLVLVEYVVNQFLVHPCQSARRGEFDSSSFLLLEVNIWLVAV